MERSAAGTAVAMTSSGYDKERRCRLSSEQPRLRENVLELFGPAVGAERGKVLMQQCVDTAEGASLLIQQSVRLKKIELQRRRVRVGPPSVSEGPEALVSRSYHLVRQRKLSGFERGSRRSPITGYSSKNRGWTRRRFGRGHRYWSSSRCGRARRQSEKVLVQLLVGQRKLSG